MMMMIENLGALSCLVTSNVNSIGTLVSTATSVGSMVWITVVSTPKAKHDFKDTNHHHRHLALSHLSRFDFVSSIFHSFLSKGHVLCHST